jgi:hypothetical protein
MLLQLFNLKIYANKLLEDYQTAGFSNLRHPITYSDGGLSVHLFPEGGSAASA